MTILIGSGDQDRTHFGARRPFVDDAAEPGRTGPATS
ncbi:hypothetical protein ACVWY5_001167 [Bradyrhizobium sp. USDA 3256]